jgi:hypothetical protein
MDSFWRPFREDKDISIVIHYLNKINDNIFIKSKKQNFYSSYKKWNSEGNLFYMFKTILGLHDQYWRDIIDLQHKLLMMDYATKDLRDQIQKLEKEKQYYIDALNYGKKG